MCEDPNKKNVVCVCLFVFTKKEFVARIKTNQRGQRETESFASSAELKACEERVEKDLLSGSKELRYSVYSTHLLGLGHLCNRCSPLLFKLIVLLGALPNGLGLQGFPLIQLSAVNVVLSATFLQKAKQQS